MCISVRHRWFQHDVADETYAETNRDGFRKTFAGRSEARANHSKALATLGFPAFDFTATGAFNGHGKVYGLGRNARLKEAFGGVNRSGP